MGSIVDYGVYNPAIDTTAFPNANALSYWSATTTAANPANAMHVYFNDGLVYGGNDKTTTYYAKSTSAVDLSSNSNPLLT